MSNNSDMAAAILAGGKSSRMGRDKALLDFNGKPFIALVAEVLSRELPSVVIISDHTERYTFLGLPVYEDQFKNCGPLGGIHSALYHSTTPHVLITSCDTPFISTESIQFLIESATPNEITVGQAEGFVHPLFGIYPASALHTIEASLNEGKRKVLDLLDEVPHSIVNLTQWEKELKNINKPEEYLKVLERV